MRDYIEAHLDDRLTLTVLAEIACLSPYHFSRSFKQAVGIGPPRYLDAAEAGEGEDVDAQSQATLGGDRPGNRLCRPEPPDIDLPAARRD